MKILGLEIRWPSGGRQSCRYQPPYDGELLRGPHCDPLVLHHPLICGPCSEYTEAINERIHKGINFTGDTHPGRAQCPAEARRSLSDIHAWVGNRPTPKEAPRDE